MPELEFHSLLREKNDRSKLGMCMMRLGDYMRYPELLPVSWNATTRQGGMEIDEELPVFFKKSACHSLHGLVKIISSSNSGLHDRTFTLEEVNILREQDSESIEQEMDERFERGVLAGMVLAYVWKLDLNGLEGSVSKSIHIVSRIRGISASSLRKIWRQYKNVSHFYAGNYIMQVMGLLAQPEQKEPPTEECVMELERFIVETHFLLLFWGLHFYGYSTNRIEPRTRQPLLDKNEAWTIPAELFTLAHKMRSGGVPVIGTVSWNMTEFENKALSSYKSNLS